VRVTIDETGQQRIPSHIHGLIAVESDAELGDAPVLDRHVGDGQRRTCPVEHPAARQDHPRHPRYRPSSLGF